MNGLLQDLRYALRQLHKKLWLPEAREIAMASKGESERTRFGPYEADLRTSELWKDGTKVKLVGQPFTILEMLLERPGHLITRDELCSRLWPSDTSVDFDHGLNAAVNRLRDAIGDSVTNPKYIETLPRRGYRFMARVERRSPVASTSSSLRRISITDLAEMLRGKTICPRESIR